MTFETQITLVVNDVSYSRLVPVQRLLSDVLRHDLGLTGTHVGCEQGVCGACTVLLEGAAIRACLTLAVSMDGRSLTTIEGLAAEDGSLHPVQAAFADAHGLQCGFCTSGMVMNACSLLGDNTDPSSQEVREGVAGILCRCTGYAGILEAVSQAAIAHKRLGTDPRLRHRA